MSTSAGLPGAPPGGGHQPALVHLDMPRWFQGAEPVPQLRALAAAVRLGRRLQLGYQRGGDDPEQVRAGAAAGDPGRAGRLPLCLW